MGMLPASRETRSVRRNMSARRRAGWAVEARLLDDPPYLRCHSRGGNNVRISSSLWPSRRSTGISSCSCFVLGSR
jgi:hypothetical protein